MSDQQSLFSDPLDNGQDVPAPQPVVSGLPQWKVDMLRAALDERGLASMIERQSLVQSVVGHEVTSLRELTSAEATTVLEALSSTKTARATSSWDDREEDTWIDRL